VHLTYLNAILQNESKYLMLTATVVILFPPFNIVKCDLMTGFHVDINLRLGQTEWQVVIQRAVTSIDFRFELVRLQDGAIGKIIGPALSRGQFTKAVNQTSSSAEFSSPV
jgi:hypothetical protein